MATPTSARSRSSSSPRRATSGFIASRTRASPTFATPLSPSRKSSRTRATTSTSKPSPQRFPCGQARARSSKFRFQWSCHIEDAPGALRHAEFLDVSGELPTRALAEALILALGDTGPILSYSPFEKTTINALARTFEDLTPALLSLIDRLKDILPVAKNNYYHPAMLGSWSIKSILPTITPDMNYANLEGVQDGMAAGTAYLEAIDPATDDTRREELRQSMLAYCRFDTEAMPDKQPAPHRVRPVGI